MFTRKPKPPLAHAVEMVDAAMGIARMYLRDKREVPGADDVGRMETLSMLLFGSYATAQSIARKMRGRMERAPVSRECDCVLQRQDDGPEVPTDVYFGDRLVSKGRWQSSRYEPETDD